MALTRTTPVIRHAEPGDARALVKLQRNIYLESRWFVGDGPPETELLTRRLRILDSDMSLYLVADYRDAICAWLELNRLPSQRLHHVAVLTVATDKTWRRHGLGRSLLGRGYGWARRVGVRKISLNVRANNRAAITLYRSEGFVVEGRERDHIRVRDGYEDNLIMAKFL